MSTIERGWTFEVEEKTRIGRTSRKPVKPLANIVAWLNHLGSGRISDSHLEARHHIAHNFRVKSIGL